MTNELFDIEKVHRTFEASLKDPADVLTDQYLEGFKELYKFVNANRFSFFHFFNFSIAQFALQIFPTDGLRIRIREQRRQDENRNSGVAAPAGGSKSIRVIRCDVGV